MWVIAIVRGKWCLVPQWVGLEMYCFPPPRVTLDKLILGSKGKAAEEGWGGKLVELAFHSVRCSLEVVPWDHAHCAENRKKKSQRKQEM